MKVQDTNLTGTLPAAPAPSAAPARQSGLTALSSGSSADGDRVELSSFTGKLGAMLGAQAQGQAARVSAIERDYQAGRYSADAQQTSHALVQETLGTAAGEKGA